jgi:ATP-binding cassette, subfamily B, bacterial MsbA
MQSVIDKLRQLVGARLPALNSGSLAIIRRLLADNFSSHWRSYAVAFAFMAVVSAMTALSAWLMRDVVNTVFVDRRAELIFPLSLAIVTIFTVKGLATYVQEITMSRIGNRIVAENQQRAFDHILRFDVNYFTTHSSSDLIMRINGGANAIREVVNMLVVSLGRDFLTLIGLVLVMVSQAPVLSIVAFVAGPIAILAVAKLIKRIRDYATSEFRLATRAIQIIQETVHGAKIVKAFNLGDHMSDQMGEAVRAVEARANKIARLQARTSPLMEALGGISVGLVMAYAGWSTIRGTQTPGEFMAFATAMLLAYEPAKRLARLHVNLGASIIGAEMMLQLLDTPASRTEMPAARKLDFSDGRIEFRNVGFAYRPNEAVLHDISFEIARNKRIALVGPSGGGKSTIFSLIARLYDVTSGEILIDGQDLRSVSPESVRSRISFVSQDTYLFGGTVRDNIRIGRLDAGDDEVVEAARQAHAHEFISALPSGYESTAGENGVQLSGGQRQRIAIARAIVKNSPIILLDEATSALDSESEKHVQQALELLAEGRTILAIAHRLSTVLHADQIIVIDRGRIVAQGTHSELLAAGGLYERLYRHQFVEREEMPRRAPHPFAVGL